MADPYGHEETILHVIALLDKDLDIGLAQLDAARQTFIALIESSRRPNGLLPRDVKDANPSSA
jgi:hypothetical protein